MISIFYGICMMTVGISITAIYFLHEDNKKLKDKVKRLEAACKLHYKARVELRKELDELNKAKPQEHELQGEFEADDESYNRIVKEWIYGADEEEGGLNGE